MEIQCPKCRKMLNISDEQAGKMTRCSECGNVCIVSVRGGGGGGRGRLIMASCSIAAAVIVVLALLLFWPGTGEQDAPEPDSTGVGEATGAKPGGNSDSEKYASEPQDTRMSKAQKGLADVNRKVQPSSSKVESGSKGGRSLQEMRIESYKLLPDSYDKRNGITFTRDGKYVASSGSGKLFFWNISSLTLDKSVDLEMPKPVPDLKQMDTLCFLTDGKTVAGHFEYTHQGYVFFWDISSGKLLRQVILPQGKLVALAVSPDGKHILCAPKSQRSLQVLDGQTGTMTGSIKLAQAPEHLAYSPDGGHVLIVSSNSIELRTASNLDDVESSFTIQQVAPSVRRTVPITYQGQTTDVDMITNYDFGSGDVGVAGNTVAVICSGRESGGHYCRTFDMLKLIDVQTKTVWEENASYPYSVGSVSLSPDQSLLAIPWNGITLKRITGGQATREEGAQPSSSDLSLENAHALLGKNKLAAHFGKQVSGWRMIPHGKTQLYAQLLKDETGDYRIVKTLVCEGSKGLFFALKDKPTTEFDAKQLAAVGGFFTGTLTAEGAFKDKTMPVLTDWSVQLAHAPKPAVEDDDGKGK